MDVVVHSHVLEECKRVVVEMCGGVLMQMTHYERFVAIFIQSIRQPGSIIIITKYGSTQYNNYRDGHSIYIPSIIDFDF